MFRAFESSDGYHLYVPVVASDQRERGNPVGRVGINSFVLLRNNLFNWIAALASPPRNDGAGIC